MKKLLIIFIFLLAGCGASSNANPTPTPMPTALPINRTQGTILSYSDPQQGYQQYSQFNPQLHQFSSLCFYVSNTGTNKIKNPYISIQTSANVQILGIKSNRINIPTQKNNLWFSGYYYYNCLSSAYIIYKGDAVVQATLCGSGKYLSDTIMEGNTG